MGIADQVFTIQLEMCEQVRHTLYIYIYYIFTAFPVISCTKLTSVCVCVCARACLRVCVCLSSVQATTLTGFEVAGVGVVFVALMLYTHGTNRNKS